MDASAGPIHFINVEYFLRIIYETFFTSGSGGTGTGATYGNFLVQATHVWLWVTSIAFIASMIALGILIYNTLRLMQIRAEDSLKYVTIGAETAHAQVEHSRWIYIKQLIESPNESDWRQAIIEADIILDEMLTRLGYAGVSVGEKLQSVNPARFATLSNAWEAHKIRNEIAHQGMNFKLPEHIAHRTVANYEATFREHHEI